MLSRVSIIETPLSKDPENHVCLLSFANWFQIRFEVPPAKAMQYATILLNNNIGYPSRLKRNIGHKGEAFLVSELGFDLYIVDLIVEELELCKDDVIPHFSFLRCE